MEIFLQQQQQQQQEAGGIEATTTTTMLGSNRSSNIFIWSESSGTIYYGGNQVLALESLQGEAACEERSRRLEIAMEDATFVVEEGDIIDLKQESEANNDKDNDNQSTTDGEGDASGCLEVEKCIPVTEQHNEKEAEENDMERGTAIDIDERNSELRLPFARLISSNTSKDAEDQNPNVQDVEDSRNKTVPGVCAICLCAYEVGDRVTYSDGLATLPSEQDIESGTVSSPSTSQCPHAFHTDCIVQWLAKKNDARPECPCCRRPFCSVAPLTTADLLSLNPSSSMEGLGSTRMAGLPSSAIPVRTMRQIPMIALPVNNENGNGNDSERRMMVLLPTPEMLALRTRNPR